MAIYRGRRRLVGGRAGVLLALGAAVAGLLVWATRKGPEPAGTARPDPIQALMGVLEILPVSYEGSVKDGTIIPGREAQYRGALDALQKARALFKEAQGVIAAQNMATARTVEESLRQLEEAVASRRPPVEVRRLTDRLTQALKDLRHAPPAPLPEHAAVWYRDSSYAPEEQAAFQRSAAVRELVDKPKL